MSTECPSITPNTLTLADGRQVRLRVAKGEDARAMLDFMHMVLDETDFLSRGSEEFTMTEEQERDFIERVYHAPTGLFIVAEEVGSGRIIGSLSFDTSPRSRMNHSGDLGVSLLHEYCGHRLGRALMELLIDWTSRHDLVRKLNLQVRADNHRAIALYLKLGFKIEGRLEKITQCHGVFYDDYVMGLWVERQR